MSDYKQEARRRKAAATANLRFVLAGTRVIIIKPDAPKVAGTISQVRTETQLKPYVVACDDGSVQYMSSYDLAREDDCDCKPLEPRPEL